MVPVGVHQIDILCFYLDTVTQPIVTTATATTTSNGATTVPEPSTVQEPAPMESLDEVDMFSQALMQLTETNKQVSTSCVIFSA